MRTHLPSQTTRALLLLAALPLCACDFAQPPIGCPVQRTTWAARFNLEPGQAATGPCAQKGGERLGIQKYDDPTTGADQLVIKSLDLAALDADDPINPSYSLGAFAAAAGPDGYCAAPALSASRKVVPASGVDIHYEWSDVQVVSRPDVPGSQLVAHLRYTEGGCSADYEVWAQWPAVYCGDDAGNPSDAACTEPGYGLNPEFASVCDPTQLRCVPEKRPPSLRE